MNHWVWTYDPREKTARTLPFDLFPKQVELLRWLEAREAGDENGLVEKSREVGVTWICCGFSIHRWLFRPGYAVGFGSRKLELVDTIGDPDCIFDKMRWLIANLPAWMVPAEWKTGEGKIINVDNGATITGEGGDHIGRGGRKTIYFVDEAAFIERAHLVERSLSQTTNCRIDVSTPNGAGNPFFAKRFGGNVPVFTFRWQDDPRKDDAWYREQCRKYDSVTVAQEIDLDYSASVEGICIPAAWVRAAVDWHRDVSHATGPLVAGFDISEEGKDKTVIVPRQGQLVLPPISWSKAMTSDSAHKAIDAAEKYGIEKLYYDCIGVGTGVKSTFARTERPIMFETVPVNVGDDPSDARWPDKRTSKEKFRNLKAELWWIMRTRFEKTFEHRTKGIEHPQDEMISLPNCPELIGELSLVKVEYTENGKIQMESKKAMRTRGIKSPDFADALALSFYLEPKKREQWWI